ncbi:MULTISPECIES: GNAT family N-acetyltransferase [Streptomyces]|uniref:GNAT family N-acetyltransferase n=1 Tax=Streptomyces TaxID=1883 RepID=UPI002253934C|nr:MULTISPECIES: GNAT family N-acetyltransferase [unclassified Streptomyces]MCX5059043.1 GNAT family N-acetyltransferase [Streptomyces sp. NBC_00452]MCZ4514499.1 GNAT family N-acetyltransferase [Streptomyces sp. ActVer]
MTAADWDLVAAFHAQCSEQNLLRRWGRTRLTPRDLTRLLAQAQCWLGLDADERPLALVCLGPVSREPGVVDLGLQVADDHHRRGIGTALARQAARMARTRGAHTLTAFTQASNAPMLRLLERLGPTRRTRDGPYVEVSIALDACASDALPHTRTAPT